MKSDSACPQGFGQPWPDGPDVSKPQIFTNTAVPRFDGTGCWQQHLLVFQAITKSNGWSPDTAASVFTVESVMPTSDESPRRGSHSSADRELLIRNVLEAMGTRRDIISGWRRNTELEQLVRDTTHVASVMIQETSSPASLPGGGGGAPAHGRQ